jgi:hypothetical protein
MRAANKLPLRCAHALLIRHVERNENFREPIEVTLCTWGQCCST